MLLIFAAILSPLLASDDVSTSRVVFTVALMRVTAAFSFGWPRCELAFADVRAVRQVRNRWWYGWDLRCIPGEQMYDVCGLDAVEFELADGSVVRLGTDEPDRLLAVVSPRIDA